MPFVAGGPQFVRVTNPIAENEACLRREILDTLARRAEYNLARMQRDIRIFEIGSVFEPSDGELPHEELRVGALIMGRRQPPHFTDPKSLEFDEWVTFGEWDAKALGQTMGAAIYPTADIALHESKSDGVLWDVAADGRSVGVIRHVALDAPVWAAPAYGVEISLGVIPSGQVAPAGESARRPFERPAPIVPLDLPRHRDELKA